MTQKVTGIGFDKSITPPQRNFWGQSLHNTLDGEERKRGNLIAKTRGSMFFMCGGGCLFREHVRVHGEITSALELRLDVTQFDVLATHEYGNQHGVWRACC
jgi:hypothetical protein